MARCFALLCLVALFSYGAADTTRVVAHDKDKRELPLSLNCNPLAGSCSKGDLIAKDVADCERDVGFWNWFRTCDPINDVRFHSVVDVPDVSKHKVNCVAKKKRAIICGKSDTRCVCDKAMDMLRPKETFTNRCRCQYWPAEDIRADQPSYCTQYDNGGKSGIHFYTCCNNCNDADSSCDGFAYQGGGATEEYCSTCGRNSEFGGGRLTYRFSCVNCAQQARCERTCSTGANAIFRHIPGFCYLWVRCFRRCCLAAANSRHVTAAYIGGAEQEGGFCGDFVCQNGEDHIRCPTDCCPHYNQKGCGRLLDNPDCCYEPACCV